MAFWEYKSKNTVFISSAMKSTNSLLQCLLQGSSENFSILEKCHHLVRTMTQGSRTNPVRSKNRKVNTSSLEKSHVFPSNDFIPVDAAATFCTKGLHGSYVSPIFEVHAWYPIPRTR